MMSYQVSNMKTHLSLICACCLLALFPCVLFAHSDARIELKHGALVGLPKKYAPAELNVKASRIRVGNHVMTFSPLLQSLFDQPHNLEISASWYHDKQILPPYITLLVHPKKKDFSYQILLNLETLQLVELSVILRESE